MENEKNSSELVPQETIDSVKRSTDLVKYAQSRGVKLTKTGKEYKGLCPFHNDTNPSFSVNPIMQLWICFACDDGGDVIKFVQKLDKLSFADAVKQLSGNGYTPSLPDEPTITHASRVQLLTRVFDYYHKTFFTHKRGVEYLEGRGIKSAKVFKTIRLGFADGSLSSKLTPEIKEQLQQLGVFTDKGRELMHECVVFPLVDSNGQIVNLYGRSVKKNQHLFLKGARQGLFFPPKGVDDILITEGVIDALTLWHAGYQNALAIYGVNGLTAEHLSFIQQQRIRKATLLLDNDEAGQNAAPELAERLSAAGVDVRVCWVGDGQDVSDFFQSRNKKDFDKLLKENSKSQKESKSQTKEKTDNMQAKCEAIDGGFVYDFGERNYRVLGMNMHGLDRLKANVKISYGQLFHIDSFDLYASRAREAFVKTSARLLKMNEGELIRELNELIDLLETKRLELLQGDDEPDKPTMSDAEKKEALRFLKSKRMLKEILTDFDQCGCIGEETAKLFGYIATISRFMEKPLGILIVSRIGAGKSMLQDAITGFVPPEDLQRYTRITGQSLFYKQGNELKNKVLSIAEEKGAEDAIYSIRTLQSDQYLTVAVTITDPKTGQKKTEEYVVEGPVVIIITTTNPEALDFETRNRFVILTVDESREQTRLILQRQRESRSLAGMIRRKSVHHILHKHHNAQRLLKPITVVNPFFDQLTYSDRQLLMRRDHQRYLTLIDSIAFLQQYQRDVLTATTDDGNPFEYIEVTLDDIKLANRLAGEVMGRSMDELSPHTRSLLQEIKDMVDGLCKEQQKKQPEITFTRRDICEYAGWSYWQVHDHLQQLVLMEYLVVNKGGKDNRCRYELVWDGKGIQGEKVMNGLIDVKKLVAISDQPSVKIKR